MNEQTTPNFVANPLVTAIASAFETYVKEVVQNTIPFDTSTLLASKDFLAAVQNIVDEADIGDPTEHPAFDDAVNNLIDAKLEDFEVDEDKISNTIDRKVESAIDDIDFEDKIKDVLRYGSASDFDLADKDHEHDDLSSGQVEEVQNLIDEKLAEQKKEDAEPAKFDPEQFLYALDNDDKFRQRFVHWLNQQLTVETDVHFFS